MGRQLLIVVLLLIAHLSSLRIIAAQTIGIPKLPRPSGHFGIGRLAYDWRDPARAATASGDPKAHRELMVYLWYPMPRSVRNAGVYLPGAKQINTNLASRQKMEGEFESNWPLVVSGAIASHAVENGRIAKNPSKFPVVLFSHGLGGSSFEYTALLEDVVSHGYVVVAVEHTDVAAAVAFPDGRVAIQHYSMLGPSTATSEERLQQMVLMTRKTIESTAADLRFALDKITRLNRATEGPSIFVGRLDLDRVAVVGHSAGGTAAARTCQLDERFKACVSLEGQVNPEGAFLNYPNAQSPPQPFLLVEVYRPEPTDEQLAHMLETRAQWNEYVSRREAQLRACSGGSYDIVLKGRGMIHASFSDSPLFASANNPADNQIALHNLELIEAITRAFLDKYLKHKSQPLFKGGPLPQEITVKRFSPHL